MTVLDAFAVIALLRGEPAAPTVRTIVDDGDAVLTAVGVGEVLDYLVRIAGADEEDVALDVAQLGLHEGVAVASALGAAAGRLRARTYHRTRCAVSMADCVAAEAARARGAALATSDPHLLDVCEAEGIEFVVLPQSDGSVWSSGAS
ncbi:MAG: PIN domain-containing protein [Sporichthyaceae bacterium]